jgi:transcriptional regulator with XRE-family HTH domain
MKLSDYLSSENVSMSEFARRIEVRNARTVQRYIRGERVPTRSVMKRISRETAGQVQPNDFFDAVPVNIPADTE